MNTVVSKVKKEAKCTYRPGIRHGMPNTTKFNVITLLILCLRYRVILSVLDPRKCEYLKDYSLDFEHAYMTTYLAS